MHRRWMERRDVDVVLRIDGSWAEDELVQTMRRRNVIGYVAEDEDEAVTGFVIYELHCDGLEILRLRGSLEARELLLDYLVTEKLSRSNRRRWLRLDVDERDLGAQLWLRDRGFAGQMFGGEIRFTYRKERCHEDEEAREEA